jgi:hypothetical protein
MLDAERIMTVVTYKSDKGKGRRRRDCVTFDVHPSFDVIPAKAAIHFVALAEDQHGFLLDPLCCCEAPRGNDDRMGRRITWQHMLSYA